MQYQAEIQMVNNPEAVSQDKDSRTVSMKWLLRVFYVIVIGESLEAYAIGPLPLSWLSVLLAIFACVYLRLQFPHVKKYYPKKVLIFSVLFVYMVINAICNFNDVLALASAVNIRYFQYLCLRLMNMLYLICICQIVSVLHAYGYERDVRMFFIWDSLIISVVAIYFYLAYHLGLPILSSNRVTTSGDIASETRSFSYAFHRAYGTFREPGLLAAWLLLPCSMLIMDKDLTKKKTLCLILMLFVLLLTGSLAGALGVCFGVLICIILLRFPAFLVRRAVIFALFVVFLLFVFHLTQIFLHNESASYTDTLWGRFSSILDEGVDGSNRAYVYDFLEGVEPGFFGTGIGCQQILLAHLFKLSVPVSLLSVFLNYLYSGGYFAFTLLLLFFFMLVFPFIFTSGEKRVQLIRRCAGDLMAFFCLILIATSQAEEFTFPMCCSIAFILAFSQNKTEDFDDTK